MITKSQLCERIKMSRSTLYRRMRAFLPKEKKYLIKSKTLMSSDARFILYNLGYEEKEVERFVESLFE
ncbi:hypothetical protein Rain11_2399 [Raineya orbicola]|uniref:Uncharacterized protein n=1 Tax=Raineya orbicola TaxID=2016530 RepID=A0A2N3I825_9BACT|nr:hypothetical protein Rain11_2399 [Raineya orbicola]